MRRRWIASGCIPLCACLGPDVTQPSQDDSINVSLVVYAPDIQPGQTAVMDVHVDIPDQRTIDLLQMVFGGELDTTFTLPIPGPGDVLYRFTFPIPHGPYEGEIFATAYGRLGEAADTASGSFRVRDDGPPRLRLNLNSVAYPGDSMMIGFVAVDAAGIVKMVYHLSGAISAADSTVYSYRNEVATHFSRFIPRSLPLGLPLAVKVTVTDGFGKQVSDSLFTTVRDDRPPLLTATVRPEPYDSMLAPYGRVIRLAGDTLEFTIDARDHFRLGWVGYRIPSLAMGDSSIVNDSTALVTVRLPVTRAMNGGERAIEYFARDSTGNGLYRLIDLGIVAGTLRRFTPLDLPWQNPPDAAVYNQRRGVVFVGHLGSIWTLSLDPFAFIRSEVIRNGVGVLHAPGRDSVWASTRPTTASGPILGMLDLSVSPWRTDTMVVPTHATGGFGLTSDNRALYSGSNGTVIFMDLTTKTATFRQVPGFPGSVTGSADGSLILGYDRDNGRYMTYRAAADQFGPLVMLSAGPPSVSADGSRVLIYHRLYDASLNLIRTLGTDVHNERFSVISPDGAFAYFAIWPGYHIVRTSDGMVVEQGYLPHSSAYMVEIPDHQQLFVASSRKTVLVDMSVAGIVRQSP